MNTFQPGSTLGLMFVLDTNIIGRDHPGTDGLWHLFQSGDIELRRTDVLDTELQGCSDPAERDQLLSLSSILPEQLGPIVWGHSRWDHAVWGNTEDEERIDRVLAILRPGRDRASVSQKDLRDSMHLATAIRYGANAFVTMDGAGRGKGMLKRARAIHDAFPGFELWTPAHALDFAERLLRKREFRRRNPLPKPGQQPDHR